MQIGNDNNWKHPLMQQLDREIDAQTVKVDDTHKVRDRNSCGGEVVYTLTSGIVIVAQSYPLDEGGFFTEYFTTLED
jgi:hypothetical protein